MFFDFNPFTDNTSETVTLEIYLGNQLVQSQQMTAPPQILQMYFMQAVQEAMAQKQPMKVKMTGVSNIWDAFEQNH